MILSAVLLAWPTALGAVEHVTLRRDGRETRIAGQLLLTAEDEGLLLIAPDGTLWTIAPDELVSRTSDEAPFEPLSADELSGRLLSELPGFEIHRTQHYLICHNTSRAYAGWCGSLFERLYRGFTNFWTRRGFDLKSPQFPLVAVVFADRDSYGRYAQGEFGEAGRSIVSYYSLRSNRVATYDLTGIEALRRPGDRRSSAAQINTVLSRPQAERTVATIIHEATHQIAFNCGLHTRYADIPLWVSEGIAMYFETPDLASAKGWRNIGSVNQVRLADFRAYAGRRPADSLPTLVADDQRFRDPKRASDAYAEAWVLNYFLIRQRPEQFLAYLEALSQKSALIWDDPAERMTEFKQAFGDLDQLNTELLRHLDKIR